MNFILWKAVCGFITVSYNRSHI